MKNQKQKPKAKSMAALHVRVAVDLVEELDALAAAAGKTRADLMRDALAGHCQASKMLEQAEQRHAAIVQILEEHERRRMSKNCYVTKIAIPSIKPSKHFPTCSESRSIKSRGDEKTRPSFQEHDQSPCRF